MGAQRPSVGRIVHYVSYGTPGGEYLPEHRAAIVTAVHEADQTDEFDPTTMPVDLYVMNPTGTFHNLGVRYADPEKNRGGSWHWPERE